jgi:glycosyltransferase involved in cell wall biosynthesis
VTRTSARPAPGEPLRSLHVAASVASRDGGSATAVLSTVRTLTRLGHDALILATTADGPVRVLLRDTTAPLLERQAPVWFCRRSRPLPLKNSWQQGLRTLREARRASILHVHGVYLANSVWAYLASLLTGTPYVVQPHGTLDPHQATRHRGRKRLFDEVIGHRILHRAVAVVATSATEAGHVRDRFPHARVAVVPLGAERVAHATPPQAGPFRWQGLPRTSRVVFVGRLAAKKRPDLLLDAWNRLDVAGHLIVAGPEQDWTWTTLRERLDPGRRDSVTYLGHLDERGVAWALQEAGLLVLPSEDENFGLVVPEAMVHGCAVVTTRATASGEHVTASGGGVVLGAATAESVVGALHHLLSSPQLVEAMGRAGQEYVGATLTWDASARALLHLYEHRLATPGRGGHR